MIEGDYAPSPTAWVRGQVEAIEAAADTAVVSIHGAPVVLLTMLGRSSGLLRKVPLIRVEHDGVYAVVGSLGGAPKDPLWVGNLRADPRVLVRDGRAQVACRAREVTGAERAAWWERCVGVFGDFAAYQEKTVRSFPLFVLEPDHQADAEPD